MTESPALLGFTLQFAIRTPSGRLYSKPGEKQMYDEWTYHRDIMGLLFGLQAYSCNPDPPTVSPLQRPVPMIFETRAEAEDKLKELRDAAAAVGVDNYGGAVVSRLCSPFTDLPAPEEFTARVTEWLEKQ